MSIDYNKHYSVTVCTDYAGKLFVVDAEDQGLLDDDYARDRFSETPENFNDENCKINRATMYRATFHFLEEPDYEYYGFELLNKFNQQGNLSTENKQSTCTSPPERWEKAAIDECMEYEEGKK